MPSRKAMRILTLVVVIVCCMGAFLLWRNEAPVPAAAALFGAAVAEIAFWVRIGERDGKPT